MLLIAIAVCIGSFSQIQFLLLFPSPTPPILPPIPLLLSFFLLLLFLLFPPSAAAADAAATIASLLPSPPSPPLSLSPPLVSSSPSYYAFSFPLFFCFAFDELIFTNAIRADISHGISQTHLGGTPSNNMSLVSLSVYLFLYVCLCVHMCISVSPVFSTLRSPVLRT